MTFRLWVFAAVLFHLPLADAGIQAASRFSAGERLCYRLEYQSMSTLDMSVLFGGGGAATDQGDGLFGGPMSFEASLAGTLIVTVIGRRDDRILAAYRIQNPKVNVFMEGQDRPDEEANIRRDLTTDLFVLSEPEGRVLSLLMDPAAGDFSRSYARALLALIQFVTATDCMAENDGWEVEEEDPSGRYVARYQPRPPGETNGTAPGLIAIRKEKLRYLAVPLEKSDNRRTLQKTIIPQGGFLALLDATNGCLTALEGTESKTVVVNEDQVGQSTDRIRLELVGRDGLNQEQVDLLTGIYEARKTNTAAVALFVHMSRDERDTLIRKNTLGDDTVESLLQALAEAEASENPQEDRTTLFLKFRALAYLHPEACAALGKVLGGAGSDSLAMNVIPRALEEIGHPQAQAALLEAIRAHEGDVNALVPLLNPLATLKHATPQTEQALLELAFGSPDPEIQEMAQLVLGAQARRLAVSAPERAEEIVARLNREMQAAESEDQVRHWLRVLGNTGSPLAFAEIAAYATNAVPSMRALALHALRFIGTPQAEALLNHALLFDPDGSVRLQAASASGYREMTRNMLSIQQRSFAEDPDRAVRLAVLDNLWKAKSAFPEVVAWVEQVASEDAEEEVRNEAKEMLAQ